jgi:hypothetical protein
MPFFEDPKQEREFDACAAQWLLRYRSPAPEALCLIVQRVVDDLGEGLISIAHFEKAYRQMYAQGRLKLITEPLKVEAVAQPEVLTAEAYRKIPASQVARKYMTDRSFKASVDRLIARKEI